MGNHDGKERGGEVGWLMKFAGKALSWYEWRMPYFPGKWRLDNWVLAHCGSLTAGQYVVSRRGLLWELDLQCPVQRSLYYLGSWETPETKFIESLIRPGWCVIDVGANFGYYALLAGMRVGPAGQVYAFEPSPVVLTQLARNIELNGFRWVHPIPFALGDREATAYIPLTSRRFQGQQGVCFQSGLQTAEIRITTLDSFVKQANCSRVDLIKVDIEGYESNFFKGACRVIHHYRPLVMFEMNIGALARYGSTREGLIAQVESAGYEIFAFRRMGMRKLEGLPPTGRGFLNVVAIPKDREKRFSF